MDLAQEAETGRKSCQEQIRDFSEESRSLPCARWPSRGPAWAVGCLTHSRPHCRRAPRSAPVGTLSSRCHRLRARRRSPRPRASPGGRDRQGGRLLPRRDLAFVAQFSGEPVPAGAQGTPEPFPELARGLPSHEVEVTGTRVSVVPSRISRWEAPWTIAESVARRRCPTTTRATIRRARPSKRPRSRRRPGCGVVSRANGDSKVDFVSCSGEAPDDAAMLVAEQEAPLESLPRRVETPPLPLRRDRRPALLSEPSPDPEDW